MGYFAGAIDGGDVTPAEDFSLPPAPGTPTGTLKGLVTNQETGSPIPGITVAFAGHDSGFGADLAATTNAAGNYTINGITYGTYPKVFAIGAGFDINVVPSMTISTPSKTKNFQLRRDWASIFGGADVTKFDPPDYSNFGCGPNGAIDQNLGSGWGSDTGATDQPDGTAVPKHITIKLPTAIDISEVAVDPAATCGDGGSASTRRYRIEVSTTGVGLFKDLSSGIFYAGNRGHLNSVALKATAVTNVRYLRFTMITPQVPFSGDACTGPADCGDGGVPQRCGPDAPDPGDFSGCQFMDMSEIEVYGSPH
jgi:hypothetical protein